jgi:ribosomal protein L37AE/L43A
MAAEWQTVARDMRTRVTETTCGPITPRLLNPLQFSCAGRDRGHERGEKSLVKCLKCGTEVAGPAKEWDMHPKDGRGPALHIKHFSCQQCGKKFRIATKLAGA